MTKSQIITKAELYLDDSFELSTQEFSDLFDKVYRIINSSRPWEGTKSQFTGATSTSVAYVSLPADFLYLTANGNYTDSSYASEQPLIFRGSTYKPYKVISWSDRRQYRESDAHAYIDLPNSQLVFTKVPTVVETVEFDYHAQKTPLTDSDSPWFPAEFHDAIYHLMCVDDFIIQQSDKAKSYGSDNQKAADKILESMAYWNSQLVQI